MISNNISLVNWGRGATIIGVFAVVWVVVALIVFYMMNRDKKKKR
ncbi:MAG: heme/copper-type cytochrome/quinol oxidase subunit 4 [Sediminicola sp.]|jgi:heme/copper-type cytochrome/quinol oxidase subunit 4|tara:strand:- start:1057 stop:1191 length:135 start_codon:yes stop_codon:yes gene_type:complete